MKGDIVHVVTSTESIRGQNGKGLRVYGTEHYLTSIKMHRAIFVYEIMDDGSGAVLHKTLYGSPTNVSIAMFKHVLKLTEAYIKRRDDEVIRMRRAYCRNAIKECHRNIKRFEDALKAIS